MPQELMEKMLMREITDDVSTEGEGEIPGDDCDVSSENDERSIGDDDDGDSDGNLQGFVVSGASDVESGVDSEADSSDDDLLRSTKQTRRKSPMSDTSEDDATVAMRIKTQRRSRARARGTRVAETFRDYQARLKKRRLKARISPRRHRRGEIQ